MKNGGIFEVLMKKAREVMGKLPDGRKKNNALRYEMEAVGMGGLSIFMLQDPSFLSHQERLKKATGEDNFASLFGVSKLPEANQIRNLLDKVAPVYFNELFDNGLALLESRGGLKEFSCLGGVLIALDGTEYHSSGQIHCEHCNSRTHHEKVTYYHSMVAAAIVSPDAKEAVALIPEMITPQYGHRKQDCENAAAKRWILNYADRYRHLHPTVLGDDLFSREPLCQAVLEQKLDFIFVCKPDSHKTLYEYVGTGYETHRVEEIVRKQKRYYQYQFMNQVPIKDGKNALLVNWFDVKEIDAKTGKVLYHNSFITSHTITTSTIHALAKAGRARWRIENEHNNTLKTKGYHFEHNYGHGKQHLASVFATLALVAFLYHTVFDKIDDLYQKAKLSERTRENFFNMVKAIASRMLVKSWDDLMRFLAYPPDKSLLPLI